MDELDDKLSRLRGLLEKGHIERDEFDRVRRALLDGAFGASDPGGAAGTSPRRKGTTLGLTEGMLLGPEDRRYRLEKLLGEGGMGEVWKAEDLAESETLGKESWKAIKVLREELARDPNHRKWIKLEAIGASRLRHQNILHIVEWREDPKTSRPFIVMEYLSGKNLNAVLAEEGSPGLPLDRVMELIVPVADALGYAWDKHQMVHRDLKPENVFLTDKGEVKLLDFGIAAQAKKSSAVLGLEGREGAGTLGYRAPEGTTRQKDPSPRSDVFSLGVMIYELLEGHAPFEGTRLRDHEPDKPDGLNEQQWEVLRRAFAFEPGKRFAIASETVAALAKAEGPSEEELRREREEVQREAEARRRAEERRREDEERGRQSRLHVPGKELPKEFAHAPQMVAIPPGKFLMGSPAGEKDRSDEEGPQHEVAIGHWFAVGKYPVTFEEWDACVADGGTKHEPEDKGWGRGKRPVVNVSWDDAMEYLAWLNRKAGYGDGDPKRYRLLSEAEWEFAARGGTKTRYYWGDDLNEKEIGAFAVFRGNSGRKTAPVGTKRPNALGLYDTSGNVREWVEDCWNENYEGAPADGGGWATGDCSRRVFRGGSWLDFPRSVSSAVRHWLTSGYRGYNVGFRVARTLD